MLAVLEKALPPFAPVNFSIHHPEPALPCPVRAPARAAAVIPAREDFVPAVPVRLPHVRRLEEPRALSEARSCVMEALEELRQAEMALERQLNGLRAYMNRTNAAAG